jgi:hypothetical protein
MPDQLPVCQFTRYSLADFWRWCAKDAADAIADKWRSLADDIEQGGADDHPSVQAAARVRHENVARINALRAQRGKPPIRADLPFAEQFPGRGFPERPPPRTDA